MRTKRLSLLIRWRPPGESWMGRSLLTQNSLLPPHQYRLYRGPWISRCEYRGQDLDLDLCALDLDLSDDRCLDLEYDCCLDLDYDRSLDLDLDLDDDHLWIWICVDDLVLCSDC